MEKAMAPHSSTLALKIPWMEEPGRLQSTGLLRVGHDWSDLAAAADCVQNQTTLSLNENVPLISSVIPVKKNSLQKLHFRGFPGGSYGKKSAYNAGDPDLIPGSWRSPGEGNGNPLRIPAWGSHVQRRLAGYSPWGHKESDTTEHAHVSIVSFNNKGNMPLWVV